MDSQTSIPGRIQIRHVKANLQLWFKIHVFIYDLRNFREVAASQKRLDSIVDASYLDMPYFTEFEVQILKSISVESSEISDGSKQTKEKKRPANPAEPKENATMDSSDLDQAKTLEMLIEETLHERLERRMKKRSESGDYRVCAAHDLAPIFERVFAINSKELGRDIKFLEIMNRSGLILLAGDDWDGIPRKSFQKKKGKK